jgi:hypothetical protein
MSAQYAVQTWVRKNEAALAQLGAPQNDIAALFVRLGFEEIARNPHLGTWDDGTLSEDDTATLRGHGRTLAAIASDLQQSLRPVPDATAQELLTAALAGYVEYGELLSTGDTADVLAAFMASREAGDTFQQFAQRLAAAAA